MGSLNNGTHPEKILPLYHDLSASNIYWNIQKTTNNFLTGNSENDYSIRQLTMTSPRIIHNASNVKIRKFHFKVCTRHIWGPHLVGTIHQCIILNNSYLDLNILTPLKHNYYEPNNNSLIWTQTGTSLIELSISI